VDQRPGRTNEPDDQTVKRYHYDTHDQLRRHLADFLAAYNFARRLKTLRGLTPYEAICKAWTDDPSPFISNPHHQSLGLNIRRAEARAARFYAEDIDAAVAEMHETFDISREDLDLLLFHAEMHAAARERSSTAAGLALGPTSSVSRPGVRPVSRRSARPSRPL
jgi:hypothetical protein